MALESERIFNSQPDQEVEERQAEELPVDNEYESEPAEDHSHPQLERQIKFTLVAVAFLAAIYAGIVWYDKHEQVARELEIVPPPPTAITGSRIFDIDKASTSTSTNSSTRLDKGSQQVSLQFQSID